MCGCNEAKMAIKQGDYNRATQLSTYRVQQNKKKYKQIDLLEKSFAIANKKDLEDIAFIRNQNIPANVEKIFNLYQVIRSRQEAIKPLLPIYNKIQHRNAIFNFVDVDKELISSKEATMDYLYKKGTLLLNKYNRFDAREAYAIFNKVIALNPDYKDVQNLKEQAYKDGQNYVFVKMVNEARVMLPEDFENKVLSITTGDLQNDWTTYDTRRREHISYTHSIIIRLQNIEVSPERQFQREYIEEKDVEEKVLSKDASDKVVKDSLGNDVYKIVTKHIKCKVTEVEQNKGANVSGMVEFYDKESKQKLKSVPVESTMLWQNFAAKANGDLRALKAETKRRLGNSPQNFPSDFYILDGASENLKPKVKNIIYQYFLLVQ
jgi:tetratricopeptide (TPR) repeat protein